MTPDACSDCCSAPLKVAGEGAAHWFCTACAAPCNAVPVEIEPAHTSENIMDNTTGFLSFSKELPLMQIGVARASKIVPDAYRLVCHRTDEGATHLKLQGYFIWLHQCGGEWRDIETVDVDNLSDDKPYGLLIREINQ